jgi:hypothetical protein
LNGITNPNNPLGVNYRPAFQSITQQLQKLIQERWCLRIPVQCAYTQNILLLQAMVNLNIFCEVSHPIQMSVAELWLNDDFVDVFFEESHLTLVN